MLILRRHRTVLQHHLYFRHSKADSGMVGDTVGYRRICIIAANVRFKFPHQRLLYGSSVTVTGI